METGREGLKGQVRGALRVFSVVGGRFLWTSIYPGLFLIPDFSLVLSGSSSCDSVPNVSLRALALLLRSPLGPRLGGLLQHLFKDGDHVITEDL